MNRKAIFSIKTCIKNETRTKKQLCNYALNSLLKLGIHNLHINILDQQNIQTYRYLPLIFVVVQRP